MIQGSYDPFAEKRAKERALSLDAAKSFVSALTSGSSDLLADSLDALEYNPDGWPIALRGAAALKDIPSESRSMMLGLCVQCGDHMRSNISNDLLLCDALRNVLPPYNGGPVLLFRGESWFNRCRRTYGLSWTDDRLVAESFAQNKRKDCVESTVLLETLAPADAIICVPRLCGIDNLRHEVESEYLIDRRRLGPVNVIKRIV